MPYDILIIGGGIVGLATAMRIKEKHPELKAILLEKENGLANHQTGNNSGVIHSGIYYRPGSLKAQNCKRGYQQLLDFCNRENIRYELCGKVIVATRQEELGRLEDLYKRGLENGLTEIKKLNPEEIKQHEPYTTGIAGIWVPYTGIIDYREVCEKYAEIFTQRLGGEIKLNQKVIRIQRKKDFSEVVTPTDTYQARMIINTAGLQSDEVARMSQPGVDVRIIPFRGEYYFLSKEKESLVKNLIYPVPDPRFPFLGVHYTRRLKGGIDAGPNAVFAFKKEGYKFFDFSLKDSWSSLTWPGFIKVMFSYTWVGLGEYWRSLNKNAFTKALQRLLPSLQKENLTPGNSGVRAQAITRDGKMVDDFLIIENEMVINVLNAPSPAATSSLSIGQSIAEMIEKKMNLK
jgi:L-2-hydroxyglutarate oxidase